MGNSFITCFCDFVNSEATFGTPSGTGIGTGGSTSGVVTIPGEPSAESVKCSFSDRKVANLVSVLAGFRSSVISGLRAPAVLAVLGGPEGTL